MQVAVSILSITDHHQEKINLIEKTDAEYLHLDIMDGIFVGNKTMDDATLLGYVSNVSKPYDIHLMVSDIEKYIDIYSILHPNYITFHYEATENIMYFIQMLKEMEIGVGISIKPSTPISVLTPYLDKIDLVLVMSVEPGKGGQSFLEDTVSKLTELKKLREENHYHYQIEVDGGINANTIAKVQAADIVVAGSFITNAEDYQTQIDGLRE